MVDVSPNFGSLKALKTRSLLQRLHSLHKRHRTTIADTPKVRARITRKWYSTNPRDHVALISMNIILLDENEKSSNDILTQKYEVDKDKDANMKRKSIDKDSEMNKRPRGCSYIE
ncbi:hypothetical protein Scep_007377 [Stephania cephalantha]|uniref:Uncharacterized protein n=1 Tax=Stephania cephalantha TaxID=152367 RepID=A0AAP0KCF3_9MAGN